MSDNVFANANGVEELIGQIVGAGSMCWFGGTGDLVFDSGRAAFVAQEATKRLSQLLSGATKVIHDE